MTNFQELGHPQDYDYESGSPHLKHARLRELISDCLRAMVAEQLERTGKCHVLEVGAGHGDFTDVLLGAGAAVTITEMSRPSAQSLTDRYRLNSNVTVVHDGDGDWLARTTDEFDVIACISVLHHIPDYVAFLELAFDHTVDGGSFVSWQDPMWYPRRETWNLTADKASYFLWRATQGNFRKGVQTRWRRLRHVYDDTNPADTVEYHVVRDGVDEEEICVLARRHFASVELIPYWSTQSRWLQAAGGRVGLATTFGIVAKGARPSGAGATIPLVPTASTDQATPVVIDRTSTSQS